MLNGSLKPQGEHPTANCLWREATEDLKVTTQCDTLKYKGKGKNKLILVSKALCWTLILRIKYKVSGTEELPLCGGNAQQGKWVDVLQ